MTINRLDPIDPLQPQKTPKGSKVGGAEKPDSIAFSDEAVEKAALYNAMELAQAAPETRADRIAELKAKIDDPAYLNDAVISMTADKIIEQLLG
jgi:negative regulator of flagellin synthesis FlgM